MTENWIHTDEAEDVAGSIRQILRTVPFVANDSQAWKWVVLALHSALQGACVCHLTTSAPPVGAITKRNTAEWLAYYENSRANANLRPPKTQLLRLPDLIKAVRKPYSAGDRSNASGISISASELTWLFRFHDDIRNQLVHFAPMGWSIEMSGVPKIAILVARIINEIREKGYAFRHQNITWHDEMQRNLIALKQIGWPKCK